jgi:hypothetical protein
MEGPQPAGQRCWGISLAHHQHSSPRDEYRAESTWSKITMTSSNIIRDGRRSIKALTSFLVCSNVAGCDATEMIGCSNVPKSRTSKLSPNSYSSPLSLSFASVAHWCSCTAIFWFRINEADNTVNQLVDAWRRCLLDCLFSCTYCSVLKKEAIQDVTIFLKYIYYKL